MLAFETEMLAFEFDPPGVGFDPSGVPQEVGDEGRDTRVLR